MPSAVPILVTIGVNVGLEYGIVGAMIGGALGGGIGAELTGGNFFQGAAMGALGGALGGVGGLTSSLSGLVGSEAAGFIAPAIFGAATSWAAGGNPLQGAVMGLLAPAVNSLVSGIGGGGGGAVGQVGEWGGGGDQWMTPETAAEIGAVGGEAVPVGRYGGASGPVGSGAMSTASPMGEFGSANVAPMNSLMAPGNANLMPGEVGGMPTSIPGATGGGGLGGGLDKMLSTMTGNLKDPVKLLQAAGTLNSLFESKDMAKKAQGMADPYSQYRGADAAALSRLQADPNSVTQTPYYNFLSGQGRQAVERSAARAGMTDSGNKLIALQNMQAGFAGQAYEDEWRRRALTSGATQLPAYGANQAVLARQAYQDRLNSAMNQLPPLLLR